MSNRLQSIQHIRRFNRFYTRFMGFLNRRMLESNYSFLEARLIYELSERQMTKASVITNELKIDPGYLSRILSKFETNGLITKTPCKIDGRSTRLIITEKGKSEAAMMGKMANEFINDKLSDLEDDQVEGLVSSMEFIATTLDQPIPKEQTIVIRPHQTGDIGWILSVQGKDCADEFGFNNNFEIKIAQAATDFISNYNPKTERSWIAELNGEKVGSIFLTCETQETAVIRLFYISPKARGLKLGQRLIDECLKFTRDAGYKRISLWTTKCTTTAQRLYLKAGFTLMEENPNSSFGPEHVDQRYELTLR